jgi:hypothetical protein
VDIETLISQLRQYNGYIQEATKNLELAMQVGTIRRPRKILVAIDDMTSKPEPGPKAQKG